ncbi:unnamed protein product (macronuclear) [Paramecium tetraurelia]|uniref:Uncharacterized protein n=1 Tax=Paramecium tetraurelia TaxID=5888 RepID=A0CKM5_PARTE|nr:uncharacterized protein GSPATT00001056001 [Paramecium tetraurelia]CAK71342.1 unnamed protein product [Paramecium tetraurelia]|eukprot:XP_001438739.1 hypothetical protein (macronuclear) [Paramecium tetraurelia strain d4-2]
MFYTVPEFLEWEETKLAMNAQNKMEQVNKVSKVKQIGVKVVQVEGNYGELVINNKKDQDFNDELKKMINQNTQLQNNHQNQRQDIQKDRGDCASLQVMDRSNQSDILPIQIKQNKEEIYSQGDQRIQLSIKGEGFSEFRIRSICFKLKCPSCLEYFSSSPPKKQQQNIYQFQSECKKCSKQMSIIYHNYIQQLPEKTQWLIGSIKSCEKVEWQLLAIQAQATCKCMSLKSQLPSIEYTLEKNKQVAPQPKRQKFQITDQNRYLCHGCAQELKFQPEFLIIK